MKLPRTELKKARIEIIPMIDTIFFLLVFFMMASLSMVQMAAEKVKLPTSTTVSEKPSQDKVVVTVDVNGSYFIDNPSGSQKVQESQIVPLLAQAVHDKPDITVVINCDKRQRITQFLRVFDMVKQANAANVLIATAPKEEEDQ